MNCIKCKICDKEFPALLEKHYIARDLNKTGLIAAFGTDEAAIFDAFDCPKCGCQVIAQQRKIDCSRDTLYFDLQNVATILKTIKDTAEKEGNVSIGDIDNIINGQNHIYD